MTTSPYFKRNSQIASVDSMLLHNWSYWNVISWKWVKYPTPCTGFTGATGNGVFGYKNCVDKMVSQCSIGYDSCSLDRYFCILYANHRSLISWSGYLMIISSIFAGWPNICGTIIALTYFLVFLLNHYKLKYLMVLNDIYLS